MDTSEKENEQQPKAERETLDEDIDILSGDEEEAKKRPVTGN
jgi:hypothetical protein